MPADRKPTLASLSFSVKMLTTDGMMMNNVHQPSKKMSKSNQPMARQAKIIPSAMMATPQMIGLAFFMVNSPLFNSRYIIPLMN